MLIKIKQLKLGPFSQQPNGLAFKRPWGKTQLRILILILILI